MIIAHNDDMLSAIFIWLAPKSLIRFKLVCKYWFSLISSDYFSNQHTLHHRHRHSKTEPSLLLRLADKNSDYFYLNVSQYTKKMVPYHFPPSLIEPTVSSFSNGLFLLQCRKTKNPLEECYIYNPTTKQSRKIVLNVNESYRSVMGLSLAFDPLNSPHYKIISVRSTKRRSASFLRLWWRFCQIEVYESETSDWKICGESFWAPVDVDFNHGVYLNCCIHWRGMFFDLHDGSVCEHPKIMVPGDNGTEKFNDNYVESCGYLRYIAHSPKKNTIMVFELESNHSEWSLKYSIDLDRVSGLLSVLSVVRGESEEDSVLVLHEPGKITGYDFEEKNSKEVVDFREEEFYQEGCIQFVSNCTFGFVETMAPA